MEESSGGKSGYPQSLFICNRSITRGGLKLIGNILQDILPTVGVLHILFVFKKNSDEKKKVDTTVYRITCFIHKMYADMD